VLKSPRFVDKCFDYADAVAITSDLKQRLIVYNQLFDEALNSFFPKLLYQCLHNMRTVAVHRQLHHVACNVAQ
jgi:hypothetical protein